MPPASIFIVEDEAIVSKDLSEILVSLGYSVAGTAKNSETAMERITITKPDLVLMDIHIAGNIDGIETAGKIHTLLNIPVVYLTAHADDQVLARAKVTEPYGYIIKPFEERGLQSAIEIALYKFGADERIKDKDALVRSLVNLNPEPVFIIDEDTTILYINNAFTRPEIPSESSPSLRTLESLASSGMISPALLTAVKAHFHDKNAYKFEEEFGGKWLSHTISPLPDQNNQISRCAIESYDITNTKKRELDLTSLTTQLENEKQSLLLFSAMLDSMDDFVIATDTIGKIVYVNRIFQQRFGYGAEEIRGKHISFLKDPGDSFVMDTNAFFVDKKKVWEGSVTLVTRFGIRIKTLLKSTTVELDHFNVYRVFVIRERLG